MEWNGEIVAELPTLSPPKMVADLLGKRSQLLLWSHVVPVGYVYATAQTLAHVDLDIAIDPSGITLVQPLAAPLVFGDCLAPPAVSVGMFVGVDSSNMGIGLAAALTGIPFFGWSVSCCASSTRAQSPAKI